MKKLFYPLGVFATALALFGALATPASAHVKHVYYGTFAHGWTNTAHTRVGLEDTAADGLWVRLDVRVGSWSQDGWLYDDTDPGGNSREAPPGLTHIRVCVEDHSCTAWAPV